MVKIEGAPPGSISWERYLKNQEKLRQNMTTRRGNPRGGARREGPALLGGLLICAAAVIA